MPKILRVKDVKIKLMAFIKRMPVFDLETPMRILMFLKRDEKHNLKF